MQKRTMRLYTLPILFFGLFFTFFPAAIFASGPVSVESRVRTFFSDTPVMIEIARCESKFRQFTDAGAPLRGPGGMVGVFQFYESIHTAPARALGFDITTLEGNLGYAKHLYETEGTVPWNSARPCWGAAVTSPTRAELEAKIVQLQTLISLLTQLLALQNKV